MNKRLYLRAFEYEDLDFINKLRNNEVIFNYTCGNKYYISSEWDRKWIEDKISNNYNQLYLMICTIEDQQKVGYICITDIDYLNRKAQASGIIINEKFSGKGYGTESTKLILEHLFYELGMNMVYGYWRTDQLASLKIAEKIGFQNDGLARSFVYKQNKFHDAYLLCILKDEFEKNVGDIAK